MQAESVLLRDDQRGVYTHVVASHGWQADVHTTVVPIVDGHCGTPFAVPTRSLIPWDPDLRDKPLRSQQADGPTAQAQKTETEARPSPHQHSRKREAPESHRPYLKEEPILSGGGEQPKDILRPVQVAADAAAAAYDIILGDGDAPKIPRANPTLRKSTLSEGATGWCDRADAIVEQAFKALQTHIGEDHLLTQAQLSRPHRLKAAATLIPFLPLTAVLDTLGIQQASTVDPDSALRLMLDYVCRWTKSTISGAASAWFRHQWLCSELAIPPERHFEGPVLTALFKCVTAKAKEDAARAPEASRRNGTTAETQVRNGLLFIHKNCGVKISVLGTSFVKKMKYTAREAPDPFLAIPIRALGLFEMAAADLMPEISELERDYCCIFVGMALACLREEQANCSEISSEDDLVESCFCGLTDKEKSNEPHKMCSQPFLMPEQGLLMDEHGKRWSRRFMTVTRPVQLGGFFLRENDSPTGDPGQASCAFNRPMRKGRVVVCFRALLHRVAGIPTESLKLYGVSSLRKFLPHVGKQNGLDEPRSAFLERVSVSTPVHTPL